jgi:hypothetical protein
MKLPILLSALLAICAGGCCTPRHADRAWNGPPQDDRQLILAGSRHYGWCDYCASRRWVEQQCAANATPEGERVFVGRDQMPIYATIIRFHNGMSIREIIDQSPLREKVVTATVMRPVGLKDDTHYTYHHSIKIGRSETAEYKLENLDLVWLNAADDLPQIIK